MLPTSICKKTASAVFLCDFSGKLARVIQMDSLIYDKNILAAREIKAIKNGLVPYIDIKSTIIRNDYHIRILRH